MTGASVEVLLPESPVELLRMIERLQAELRDARNANAELMRHIGMPHSGGEAARESRRAALNLMEDAVQARRAEHAENTERRQVEEQLRVADRRKDEFLATLAHELRNPLAAIRTSLYVLKLSGSAGEGTHDIHEILERQMTHLVRLVDDLMEVSRITRGQLTLRIGEVDLATVVTTAVEASKPLIDAAQHQLVIELPPVPVRLEADAVRLSQVLTNLLSNASKYTDPGGRISLTARMMHEEVEIGVRDTGLGIPPEMLPRIFDMFVQVDRTLGRSQGGLGIGLTLVRTLVEAHGGTVEGRSDGPGCGSEFLIRLPLAPRLREGESCPA